MMTHDDIPLSTVTNRFLSEAAEQPLLKYHRRYFSLHLGPNPIQLLIITVVQADELPVVHEDGTIIVD